MFQDERFWKTWALSASAFVVGFLGLRAITLLVGAGADAYGSPGGSPAVEILVRDATIIVPDAKLLEAAIDKAARERQPAVTWPPAASLLREQGEPVPPTFVEPLFREERNATPLPELPLEIPPHSAIEITINEDGTVEYSEPQPIETEIPGEEM